MKRLVRLLYHFASEIFLILIYPLASISLQFVPENQLLGHGGKKTILIVERWLSINFKHLYWKYYLEKRGFNVYLVNFPLWYKDFDFSARRLSEFIEKHDLKNITIVGISSGALTSLLYLQELNGWDKVDKFISIGTPFRGTWAALFLVYLYSGRELLPTSRFMSKINNLKILNPEKIVCIRAKFDEMVPSGSVLPGSKEVKLNIFGHNNLHIKVRSTYRKIVELAKD